MDNATYDVLIVGGGQAGIPLAYKLAGEGMSVALAERKYLGGSCVNFGCTPTKAVIARPRSPTRPAAPPSTGWRYPRFASTSRRCLSGPAVWPNSSAPGWRRPGGLENPLLIQGHARFEGATEEASACGSGSRP
jgi:cation diffusion facilitator CzcD-associated flavoprotein CzcO